MIKSPHTSEGRRNKGSSRTGKGHEQHEHTPDGVSHLSAPGKVPFSRNEVCEPRTMETPPRSFSAEAPTKVKPCFTATDTSQGWGRLPVKANRTLEICTGRWRQRGREARRSHARGRYQRSKQRTSRLALSTEFPHIPRAECVPVLKLKVTTYNNMQGSSMVLELWG